MLDEEGADRFLMKILFASSVSLLRSGPEEQIGAQFETFSRRGIRRCGRILESRMRGEARGAAVVARIEAFDQQRFVAAHLRGVEPAMTCAVGHIVGLAAAVAVKEFRRNEVSR